MNSPRVAAAAVAVLSLWTLAANVAAGFPRSRVKLVTTPVVATSPLSLPLVSASRIPGEQLVLVYRVRNTGTAPVTITAHLGDRVLQQIAVPVGAAVRLDLAWPRAASPADTAVIELSGSSCAWTLDYAELANLHGFTRGVLELLVLPARQPFTPPHPWGVLILAAWSAIAIVRRPAPWPRWARAFHGALALLVIALLLLTTLSPWLSPYRIVLSAHSFVLALAVIWVRQVVHVISGTVRLSSSMLVRADRTTTQRLAAIGIGVVAVAYATLLWLHMGAYAGGSDSSGYMNHARLLTAHQVSTPIRRVPGLPYTALPQSVYVPLGFRPHGAGAIAPTYPMGLPMLVAAAAPAFGWLRAPGAVMLLHALLGVVLTALLARACGLSRSIAMLGAILLATSPLYLFMSVQLMSDTPALVWTCLAVVLCLRRGPHGRRAWSDLLAGVAVSMAVLVRPTNILILLPVAICLGTAWRRWLCVIAGGAPGAALLLAFNIAAYGRAITTGYGDTTAAFAVGNVLPSLRNYVTWLPVLLTPIGLLAIGLPLMVRRHGRLAVVLIAWAGSFLVFYAFYYHTHEWWWYLRFLLPAFPPLLVGALWVGASAWTRWGSGALGARTAPAAVAVLTAFALAHNAFWIERLEALQTGHRERIYVDLTSWATGNLPADASVLTMQASGAFHYYTAFPIVRWDRCDRAALGRLEAHVLDTGTSLYAVLFPFEIEEQRAFDHIPGMWSRVGRVGDVTIWRLVATDDELSTSPIVGERAPAAPPPPRRD